MRISLALALVLLFAHPGPGYAQQPVGLPLDIVQELKGAAPAGTYTEVARWSAAGPQIAHQAGRAVRDPAAEGAMAWEARLGRDSGGSTLIYGPYASVPPGDYVAFYRIKLLEDAGAEEVASIDAAVNNGQEILAHRDLTGDDLSDRFVQVPLGFHDPGGRLECRVNWSGYSSIRVDRITLFRVEGADLRQSEPRAAQPEPTGLPQNLAIRTEHRPFPDLFPRSNPPAHRLVTFDLHTLPPDWQMALYTLQGLVNRSQPRLYLLATPNDSQWLAWMKHRGWIDGTSPAASTQDLFRRFRTAFKGFIITDPHLPASKNVATMMAGLENGIVVSPRIALSLGLPVLEDLRGRWHTSVDAYRWSFEHLWPRLNHHVIGCLYPDHLGLRDYLVENRIFLFWISGPIDGAKPYANPQAELHLMEELLAQMPTNIPVMGYPWAGKDVGIGEGGGVGLFAQFGKYLVGSIDTTNLSVHSGIRVTLHQKPGPAPPRLQNNRIYVSWIISDGDNLPVLTVNNFPQLWAAPQRGRFPIGWTMSPSAAMLLPDVADFYFSTETPEDEFVTGVSGVGYTYPDQYGQRFHDRARVFDGFLDQTRLYMARCDETIAWIMGVTRDDLIARYADRIPFLTALFPDYGRTVSKPQDATYPTSRNVPVFHAITGWQEGMPREQQIRSLVAQIRAMTPANRPAFLHLFALNWFTDLAMLQEVLRQLGPDYVAVRPDQLAALYRQYLARQQMLVRAPVSAWAVEGRSIAITVPVQNVSGRPLRAEAAVTSGLRSATLQRRTLYLDPAASTRLRLTGTPTTGPVLLRITSSGGARSFRIPVRVIPASELIGGPTAAPLEFVDHYTASALAHTSGRAAADPQASDAIVWTAAPGRTDPGYIVFGPYSPLPAGDYLAIFRLKRTGEGNGPVATLDISTNGGKQIEGALTLMPGGLPAGEFRSVLLPFHHPGGPVETRVNWPGAIPIAVDSITLFAMR